MNNEESLENGEGRLNRSNFKSVPILFEKQRKCFCNNENITIFTDSSCENFKEKIRNNSLYKYGNNSNNFDSDSRYQSQFNRVSDNSNSFGINRNQNEIKEVKKYYEILI